MLDFDETAFKFPNFLVARRWPSCLWFIFIRCGKDHEHSKSGRIRHRGQQLDPKGDEITHIPFIFYFKSIKWQFL